MKYQSQGVRGGRAQLPKPKPLPRTTDDPPAETTDEPPPESTDDPPPKSGDDPPPEYEFTARE